MKNFLASSATISTASKGVSPSLLSWLTIVFAICSGFRAVVWVAVIVTFVQMFLLKSVKDKLNPLSVGISVHFTGSFLSAVF